MRKVWLIGAVPLLALLCAQSAPSGCSGMDTTVTSAICTDIGAVQASGLSLNKNQQLALTGLVQSCAATAGGTQFNNATLVAAMINDAILLQSSGLLTNVKLKALAPEQAQKLQSLKVKWQDLAAQHGF